MKHEAHRHTFCSLIHWPDRLWKSVAWMVIVCFSVNCLTPAVVAAKTLARDAKLYAAPAKSEYDLASDALITLEDTLDRMNRRLNGQFEFGWQETLAQKSHATPLVAAKRADLATLESSLATNQAQLDAQAPTIQAYFTQTQSDLKTHGATSVIQARAQAQAAQFAKLYAQLKTLLAAIHQAKTDADYKSAVATATAFLHSHSSKPKRAKFDPNHLAFGPPKERARKALTDPAAIRAALGLTGGTAAAKARMKASSQATGAFTLTRVPTKVPVKSSKTASNPAKAPAHAAQTATLPPNLSPSEDVQITPAITAKAQALNNNALQIYQFVRNNVEYMPTYGSIQGSDYTLQTLRGNDIDQASLLIALLRAANIPAHYVYGTIRVPIAQVENWVGGVTDANAALDLMGQGGIPTLGLTQGGVIKFAQIEHVWVEAQIGFAPGRGAITQAGTTWVPMDPSFKQYAYTQGMNLQTAVPFDAQNFVNQIQSTSTINTQQGWVQNVDQNYINTQLTNYQTQAQNYVNQQNPNATVGNVIGTKSIVPEALPLLAGSLPYTVATTASIMNALPDTLRWAFHYQVDGQTLLSQSLPSLAGHLLALSFDPATPQDEATLESYIPSNITDPSQLPTSLPAGVVQLQAQFSIDGQTTATGPTYGLGAAMTITKGLYIPSQQTWQDGDKTFSAGDYQAVGLDGQGISKSQILQQQSELQSAQSNLDAHSLAGLTKHDLVGVMLQASVTSYFAKVLIKSMMAARATGVTIYPLPSYGTISTDSTVRMYFGIPIRMTPDGALVDMDRLAQESALNTHETSLPLLIFNKLLGSTNSREESGILESQFGTVQSPVIAVSAIKALSVASQQGQKIYSIDSRNASTALTSVSLPLDVIQDIADAVNAGDSVACSQSSVTYAGLTTVGYIIADPTTGSASYKVFSGSDGAKALLGLLGVVLLFLAIVTIVITGIAIIAAIIEGAIVAVLTAIGELVASYITAITIDDVISNCKAPTALQFILTFFAMMAAGQIMELPIAVDLIVDVIDSQWSITDSTIENVCGKS